MANELGLDAGQSSLTVTATVISPDNSILASGVACAEIGSTGVYVGDMPAATAGR